MYSKVLKKIVLIVTLVASATLLADDRFRFGGYFRAGTGGNSEGGDQVCFQTPGSGAKFRLGNECESYTELDFYYSSYAGPRDVETSPRFDMRFTVAAVPEGEDDFEQFEPAFRNLYAKAINFFDEGTLAGTTFWGGKRFYRRNDVHMNDFYYWDTSGVGAGIEDISLAGGKFHVAYFRNTNDDFQDFEIEDENGVIRTITGEEIQVNDLSVQRLDLRLSDIKTSEDGNLTFGLDLRDLSESRDEIEGAEDGIAFHIQHHQDKVFGGFNKVALQYGEGLSGRGALGKGFSNSGAGTFDDDKTWRLVEQLVWQPEGDSNWAGQFTLVYEDQDFADGGGQEWIGVGVRPVYWFTDHVSTALEIGYNRVKPEDASARTLSQAVLALQLGREKDFWSRPLLRAFVGYYDWNDAANVAGVTNGDNPFDDQTDGVTYGIQAEAWW